MEGPHARLSGDVSVGEAQAPHGQQAPVLRKRYLEQNEFRKKEIEMFPDVIESVMIIYQITTNLSRRRPLAEEFVGQAKGFRGVRVVPD